MAVSGHNGFPGLGFLPAGLLVSTCLTEARQVRVALVTAFGYRNQVLSDNAAHRYRGLTEQAVQAQVIRQTLNLWR